MFSYVNLEQRVPQEHPLRAIRRLVEELLRGMNREFEGLYASTGRPSIAPERLMRAVLLQVFYSVRSERLLIEQLDYNLLFRWFVGLDMKEPVWNHAVFSKNRDRLLNQKIAQKFFQRVCRRPSPISPTSTYGGWHLHRSLGQPEELSGQRWRRRSSGRVSRRPTQQRNACIEN